MKLLIEIPKEFEEHFNMDKFKDSLERIGIGVDDPESMLVSRYDYELIEMLRDAFIKAEIKE